MRQSGGTHLDDKGLKARLQDGRPLTGAFVPAPSPELVEIAAHAGYDFVVLDAEHGPLDFADIRHMIRAAQAVGVPVLVRVPTASKDFIGRALDSGADGILVPQVSSAEDARAAVAQALYPPEGVRGAAYYARAYGYTRRSGWDALDRIQDNVVVGVMLETPQAIEQARAISETPGVDFVLLGTGDLGVALGRGERHTDELASAVGQVAALARGSDMPFGASATDRASASPYLASGFRIIVVGLLPLLLRSATALCDDIREARP